ncbi:MAG: DNA-formamidopyrimidine glycosylase family protein [Acidimicrobiales bacterium]
MPEGDTLRQAAALLSPVLDGREVTEIWFRKLRGHRPRAGHRIDYVEAVGKNLLVHFERNLTLRTHLGMTGSWRRSGPDIPAPSDPRLRILIRTDVGTALCFAAPSIETFVRTAAFSPLAHLGPDVSDDGFNSEVAVARTRQFAGSGLVAEALLDQRVAAGIGNVFKSEVAFLAGVHPFSPVESLTDAALHQLWVIAHQQLVDNRERNARKTTSVLIPGRMYVYGRFRQACRRCSDSVLYSAAGEVTERSTYWCPRCQGNPSPENKSSRTGVR